MLPKEHATICENSGAEALPKAFTGEGQYCRCCLNLSRDLCLFFLKPQPEIHGPEWTVDLAELAQSAEAGCQLCGFVVVTYFFTSAVYKFGPLELKNPISCCVEGSFKEKQLGDDEEKSTPVVEKVAKLRKFCAEFSGARVKFRIEPLHYSKEKRYEQLKMSLVMKWNFNHEGLKKLIGFKSSAILEVYPVNVDSVRPYTKGRPINTNPKSEESLNQAKSWIENCLHNHPECPSLHDTALPTRVLEIIDSDNIRLYTPKQGEIGVYNALSYCWGGPQKFQTTTTTIEHHSKGFYVSRLPQTLQDAIFVTRSLGVQYIWIDALCIIQDVPEDKAKEIPKLSSYYKNSHVTICAGGNSVDEGFLQPKHECHEHPGTGLPKNLLKVPIMWSDDGDSNKQGKIGSIYFCEQAPHFLSFEPVSKRAWTLQEQLLSPRFLLYGQRLVWQCHSAQLADGGVEDWSVDTNASSHRRLQFLLSDANTTASLDDNGKMQTAHLASSALEQTPTESRKETFSDWNAKKGQHPPESPPIYKLWYDTIRGFSRRNISFSHDKLPAIAGLAMEISLSTGDIYLAGLWKSQLLRDLMWSTYPTLRTFKPEVWRAPTWSWASVDNDINFARLPTGETRAVAEVVNCETTLCYPGNIYGEVTTGMLNLKAPIIDLEREGILGMMKQDFAWVGPSGESFASMCRDINLLPQDGSKHNGPGEWDPPENLRLLILWAEVLKEEDSSVIETKPGKKGKTSDNLNEKEVDADDKVHSSDTEGGEEELTVNGKMAGLLITQREDGRYERVSSFTGFNLTLSGGDLFEWLDLSNEVVELV